MKTFKYSLGLDIGTTSVGWAVIDLEKQRIHDLGVRIFEKPENPQNGDSLAKPRRDARSARRRLHRRRHRLNNLKQFFIEQKILSDPQIKSILDPRSKPNFFDVYKLRAEALTRELTPEELFKVLYHLSKRRGYKSNRKVDEESDSEGGRVIKALKVNQQLLSDNKYQTAGQALAEDKAYQAHKRNKRDSYANSFARADFLHELEEIIKAQKPYALHDVSQQSIKELVYGVNDEGELTEINAIMYQRPFMTEELINSMVGECTFETGEKRAPKASYSFEVFRFAADLSNLVFIPKNTAKHHARKQGLHIQLNEQQIHDVINEAKKVRKITYKKVRSVAGIDEDYVPEYVRGKVSSDDPYGEGNEFGSLKAYHDIRSALKGFSADWQKVDNEEALNQIAYILTVQRADEAIRRSLEPLPISDAAKEAILKIKPKNFRTFGHLSIKALQKITPHILAGKTYDKACEAVGYDFRKKAADLSQVTNPVVKRAISQTNKVVRAIIRKYGKPY
ncbi:type II CRISPR RNA-guided endonuclease Cas9 [Candidatus Saccharibacteria bacterium]|nr:MAG: type II CRISPR RNA-guided endonuclease Cas9 [Candidatus Saccharibacteria bacterium]